MVAEKPGPESPIHVHVARDTPVHVHVKKPRKKPAASGRMPVVAEQRISEKQGKAPRSLGTSYRKSTKPQRTQGFKVSHGAARVLSIPPPSQAAPIRPMTWEGNKHRLEILTPNDKEQRRSLRLTDLSDSEDEGHLAAYKEHITELVDEVDTLRNEVDMQKSSRALQRNREQLDASRYLLEEQEHEIKEVKTELNSTMKENELLRHSFGKLKDEMEMTRSEAEQLGSEKNTLLKKLIEAEQDSKAAAIEIAKLRKSVHKLKQDKKLSINDVKQLEVQREDLIQRLQDFESSNRNLRKLLRAAHRRVEAEENIAEQRDLFAEKLAKAETKLHNCELLLSERDRQIETLVAQVEAGKEQAHLFEEKQKTTEATKAHLQGQLRNREHENSRLNIKVKSVEDELRKQALEVEHLQGLLAAVREKSTKDKEGLKKATRIQKERAIKCEEALETVNHELEVKEKALEDLRLVHETSKEKYNKISRDKAGLETEVTSYRSQMQDLKAALSAIDKGKGVTYENLVGKVADYIQELKLSRLENDRARNDLRTVEEKLRATEKAAFAKSTQAQAERNSLQSAVDQYQTLITEYKAQVDQYKKENDDLSSRLHQKEKELARELSSSSREMDRLRSSLQSRLSELEPYPELLKASEVRLNNAKDRVLDYEERTAEQTKLIADLTQKVESQSDHIDRLREKFREKQDEFATSMARYESLENKISDLELQNRELMNIVSKRDEAMRMMQDRIEDQRHENTRLVQQLEVALADAKRQAEQQKEKAITKERTAQARILDLESQLARSSATAQQLRKAKDETERKYNSRLQDMRDRLEQANSTTRSMQNYVSFLKSSYSTVFQDAGGDPYGVP